MATKTQRGVQNTSMGSPGTALSSLVPTTAELSGREPAGAPVRPQPAAPRVPTRVDATKLQQMRNLTAFYRSKGRPLVELGELLDEALEEYLGRKRQELNDGKDFPEIGKLR